MSNLSQKTIEEFQQVVREDYGKKISSKEAADILGGAVSYFDLLAKIHHRSMVEARDLPLACAGGESGALSKAPKTADFQCST